MSCLLARPKNQFALCILVFWILSLFWIWSWRQDPINDKPISIGQPRALSEKKEQADCPEMSPISCRINDQVLGNIGFKKGSEFETVGCLFDEEEEEVYVPTSFAKKYFDIYGELKESRVKKGSKHGFSELFYSWSHSYSKVFPSLKDQAHFFQGPFLQFAEFDVENRPRVKCVSASEGVPVSTQWSKEGYYYSTQISQYALSHWSKHLKVREEEEEGERKGVNKKSVLVLENGKEIQANWVGGDLTRVEKDHCVHFDLQSKRIEISLDHSLNDKFIFSASFLYRQDVVLAVIVQSGNSFQYVVKYVPEDFFIKREEGNEILIGYGSNLEEGQWKHLVRNVLKDIQKGIGKKAFAKFSSDKPLKMTRISVEGVGCVTNITLSNQEHLKMFLNAANWLVKHQDAKGGWPVDVVFNKGKTKYPMAEEIQPGWYSAMAQGHALSVLSRAYSVDQDSAYAKAALKALDLYSSPSEKGGFMATFMNNYTWYEEYPTNPPTFVLNGFMYSLLGLQDLKEMQEIFEYPTRLELVKKLLEEGMRSLKTLLPLYDTGSGSVYDLRHFTMAGSEPKIARWDYHSTHINLLYAFSSLVEDSEREFFLSIAERWRGYMLGKRARHN